MIVNAYVCRDCNSIFQERSRFCPQCDGEKTMEFHENRLLKNLLKNIVSNTEISVLENLAEISGVTQNGAFDVDELFRAIDDL